MKSDLLITTDLAQCSYLWNKLISLSNAGGVTSSFHFRNFYSSLFNRKAVFLYDNLKKPTIIIPLSQNDFNYDWFGTSELNFPPLLMDFSSPDVYLAALKKFNLDPILLNVEKEILYDLLQNSMVETYERTGTKVEVTFGDDITGSKHWSERNLYRSKKAMENLAEDGTWKLFENPSATLVSSVLEDNIKMFANNNKKSKFTLPEKKEKYIRLFTSDILEITSVVGEYVVENDSAVRFLAHVYREYATISVIATNVDHKHSKPIAQYGFRYAVSSLPKILHDNLGSKIFDYQGGNHSWKQEVSEGCQFPQFRIKLKYGSL